jgi:tRNA 5-methylaminomethyl-2-thiouridine biosynthesis bifunctional protein
MSDTEQPRLVNKDQSTAKCAEVLVIGGGIAGSTVAAVLAQSGLQVSVIDPMQTHGTHLAAALTPVISSDDNARSRLSRLGAALAAQWWQQFGSEVVSAEVVSAEVVSTEVVSPCGAIQLQRPEDAKRVTDLKAQAQAFADPDWARWVERDEASALAGMPLPRGGIWYRGGWLVRVPKLINAMQSLPNVTLHRFAVGQLKRVAAGWLALDASGEPIAQGRHVVLANAFDVLGLLSRSGLEDVLAGCARLPAMHRLAGEITLLPAQALGGGPKCIVGGDGYVLPSVDGWCVSGGTYVRDADQAGCTEAGRMANWSRAQQLLDIHVDQPQGIGSLPGWAGWRAVLPGRLPAIGALPGVAGLWTTTAGASRGLTWSVLGANLIRDQILGQELGLESGLDQAMRHAIRP